MWFMSHPAHVVSSGPHAGPPSPARIAAALARAQRLHAFAVPRLALLFGPCIVAAFARRVDALAAPPPAPALARRVASVQQFASYLSGCRRGRRDRGRRRGRAFTPRLSRSSRSATSSPAGSPSARSTSRREFAALPKKRPEKVWNDVIKLTRAPSRGFRKLSRRTSQGTALGRFHAMTWSGDAPEKFRGRWSGHRPENVRMRPKNRDATTYRKPT